MKTAILAGIPVGYVVTARSALSKVAYLHSTWSIKFVPSSRKEPEVSEKLVQQALGLAAQSAEAHVIGFSAQRSRQDISDRIKSFFRFRWFDHSLLRYLGSSDPSEFVRGITSVLEEESEWAKCVKPKDTSSPLLLPESSFVPERAQLNLWRHAYAYGDAGNIIGAEKAIKSFEKSHNRKVNSGSFRSYKWIDRKDRVFDQDGPRHGVAPFPRGWKYSYQIEEGFHFDVTHLEGHEFVLIDANGRENLVKRASYLNLDPHGYVRNSAS
jgi:hypothetical protein